MAFSASWRYNEAINRKEQHAMNESIGNRISKYRKEKGLTQEELAAKLGVSSQAVSKWENDASCPDISLLPQLCRTLGITTDELLTGNHNEVKLIPVEQRKSLDELTNSELKKLISADKYKEIYSTAATQAMATVKSRLLIEYLCDELDIKITSKEYKAELKKTFEEYKADTSMMYYYYQYYGTIFTDAQQLEDYFGKDELELQFKTTKMSDALVAKVKVVD
jgi:transcriptional regulator with XRE-family HTH domain